MSKIKFLPKKILESLNENQTYPSSLRHGKSAINSYFDDSKTIIFNNNENISLPSTANVNVVNKLNGFGFQTDININGKTNSEASLYVTNLINNEKKTVEPFTEDNIPDDFFYSEGTTFLTSKVKDKDIIKIKLPIPKNQYFSGDNNTIEILTLSPGLNYDEVSENAGWLKTEIILNSSDKNLNFKKAFTDPLGNIVNHNLTGENSYSSFINEITSQSLNRSNFSDNLKIKLSDYINKPFAVEKVNITFYGTPSTDWLNSKTKLNYSGSTYTMSGSAITAILTATNSGYYKTIFTGTIASSYDVKDQEFQIISAENQVFPIGFNTWSTPTFEISNSSLNKITLKGNSSFSNGAVQFIKTSSYEKSVTLLDGNIYSTKKIGRSNSGFNSGFSKFSNEYNLPCDFKTSTFVEDGVITLLGGFYNHIFNNFQTHESPCVLKPTDSLIFTLSKYIGENEDSFIIGGNEIEPTESDFGYLYEGLDQTNYIYITLYGSYLNLNKEKHDLYNQNTITDSIHETIGDDIVVDEYNCYPVNTLSGSSTNNSKIEKSNNFLEEIKELGESFDNIVINDLKWNTINSYETNVNRILDNKKLFQTTVGSSNITWYQESILSSSFNELKNKLRYVQLYDNNEYYYDSLTPSFDDILKNQNKKIMNLKISGFESFGLYDGIIFISNSTIINDLESDFFIPKKFILENWQFKFPYDDEFVDCKRLFNEKILLEKEIAVFNDDITTQNTQRNLNTDLNLLISIINNEDDYSGFENVSFKTYCDFLIGNTGSSEFKFLSGLSYRDYKKVLFGSRGGTGLLNKPNYLNSYQFPLFVEPSGYTHFYNPNPYYPVGDDNVIKNLALIVAPKIDGWKYGLYNGIETQTKMQWNMNHYGHFRDLIEQRQYTTFYYLKGKNSGVSAPAINVFFIDPLTQTEIDPELTDSSNLNYDASSSKPYFDGEFKNRTYTKFTINNPVVYSNNVITQI